MAHITDKEISKEDANDLLDFSIAICEYVFTLTNKFNDFINRQAEKIKKQSFQ